MEKLEIIYHILAFLFAMLAFFLNLTVFGGPFKQIIMIVLFKVSASFTMFYAGLKLTIIFGLL